MTIIYIIFAIWLFKTAYFAWPVPWPKVKLHDSKLSVFYGAPGSGKTTVATYMAQRALKSGYVVYSNVPIKGCRRIDTDSLGRWDISHSLLIWDEAGLDFNNRDFASTFSKKSGTMHVLKWFKYHRHEHVEVAVFSQGWDDLDKKIRDLNTDMYICRRSLIPYIVTYKRIKKRPDIDKQTKQPIDAYRYTLFGAHRIFMPPLWKYFDSYEGLGLPQRQYWPVWGKDVDDDYLAPAPLYPSMPPEA